MVKNQPVMRVFDFGRKPAKNDVHTGHRDNPSTRRKIKDWWEKSADRIKYCFHLKRIAIMKRHANKTEKRQTPDHGL
jgi:hypothetical protein